jgi:hypothetical protein
MITFKTKILSMSPVVEPTPNYIVGVSFNVTGSVDSLPSISIDSFVNFDINPNQTDFAPYEKLTEEEVLSWIDPLMMEVIKNSIEGQINAILNPPVVPEITPLPWATK